MLLGPHVGGPELLGAEAGRHHALFAREAVDVDATVRRNPLGDHANAGRPAILAWRVYTRTGAPNGIRILIVLVTVGDYWDSLARQRS